MIFPLPLLFHLVSYSCLGEALQTEVRFLTAPIFLRWTSLYSF